jgi:hypothetical protein
MCAGYTVETELNEDTGRFVPEVAGVSACYTHALNPPPLHANTYEAV